MKVEASYNLYKILIKYTHKHMNSRSSVETTCRILLHVLSRLRSILDGWVLPPTI